MKIRSLFFTSLLTLSTVPTALLAYECDHSRNIDREIEVSNAPELQVLARAGRLEIKGEDGASSVSISARLCAENKDDLKKMDVVSRKRDGKLFIETIIPRSGGWSDNDYKSIDLVLLIPSSASLNVEDSSGEASVSSVKSVIMNDSSGALYIRDIGGNIKVTDSSGAMVIEDVLGDIELTDSSGSIEVKNVSGELYIKVDSSGEIRAENMGSSVIVDKDSSGSITVKNVKGDFIVRQDGSGGISYSDVGGQVDIPDRKRQK